MTGNNGDYYLDKLNGNIYKKMLGSWSLMGNIKGPAGMDGIPSNPPKSPNNKKITNIYWDETTGEIVIEHES